MANVAHETCLIGVSCFDICTRCKLLGDGADVITCRSFDDLWSSLMSQRDVLVRHASECVTKRRNG